MNPPRALLLLPISLLFLTGCQNNTQEEITKLRNQNRTLELEVENARQKVAALEREITGSPPAFASPSALTLKSDPNAKFDLYRFPPDYNFADTGKHDSENEPFILFSAPPLEFNTIPREYLNPLIPLWHAPWGDLIDDNPRRK